MEFLICDGCEEEYKISMRICGVVVHTGPFVRNFDIQKSSKMLKNYQKFPGYIYEADEANSPFTIVHTDHAMILRRFDPLSGH